ncbi:MAG: PEP/pyruvate-binding domain-containing protein, partial [Alphaproteobacteria bacterium]
MSKPARLIWYTDCDEGRAVIGGKAAGLAKLAALGRVPPWFVLTAEAFGRSAAPDGGGSQTAPVLPPETVASLIEAARTLAGPDGLLAVRSSCVDEDGEEYSFAGQFVSLLNVKPKDVPEAALSVWRSGFAPGVVAYRRTHGLGSARAPAVLFQVMVNAEKFGVAFGADP